MLVLTRRITRHPAGLANAARKTSWAAPEAPSWLRRLEHWLRPPAPRGDPLQLLPWELTSPAALETRGDAARDADLLSYAGVVVRRNAVCRDAVAACRVRAEELAAEATRRAAAAGADAGDASAGFHFADASQRGPFRLDLRLGAALDAPPFDALELGAIWPHVRNALGEGAVLRRKGLVVGLPGASDQARRPRQITSARWRRGGREPHSHPRRRTTPTRRGCHRKYGPNTRVPPRCSLPIRWSCSCLYAT